MISVLIVEDQRMARENMENHIRESGRYHLAAAIPNAALAELYCMQQRIDLVLMDICTENDESGLEAAERLKRRFPQIKIIMVTSMAEADFLKRAKVIGAESFWYKEAGTEKLLDICDRTMAGESIYPQREPEVKIGLASSYEFTDGERKVLRLLVDGLTYKQIASELKLSPDTVKSHISSMLSKTGYTSKTKLAVAVSNKKLIVTGF